MKRFVPFLSVLCLFLAGCAAPRPDPQQMVTAANELDDRFLAAFNGGDLDAMLATYWNSPEMLFFPPDTMMVRGFDGAKAAMASMMETMAGGKLELIEKNNHAEGDVVLGWGLWRLTLPGPDGNPMVLEGRYTDVKAMRDGKWVYLVDHASMPIPPPPPSSPH